MFEKLIETIVDRVAEKVKGLTEEAYAAGYEAGFVERAFKEKEDQNRRLLDLYRIGYNRGKEEAKAEVVELDTQLFDELAELAMENAKEKEKGN